MTISERYRELVSDVAEALGSLDAQSAEGREVRKASLEMAALQESVGEIARIRLESELTPVLLKAHGQLDRARLLLAEQGDEDLAASVWDLEQKIYRLLNDL